jgi:hypothetical protein
MAPTCTASIPGPGGNIVITLDELWTSVMDITGIKCGYKTFRECGSIVKVAKTTITNLAWTKQEHGLSPEEEEKYEIMKLMISNHQIPSQRSLLGVPSIEYQVNEISMCKFIEIVRK